MCGPLSVSDLVQIVASEAYCLSLNLTPLLGLTFYSYFQIIRKLLSLSVPHVFHLENEPNRSFLVGFIGRLNVIMCVKTKHSVWAMQSINNSIHINFSLLYPYYLA